MELCQRPLYCGNRSDNFFEKYHISDDKEEPLIQLADILAGSYGRVFNTAFIPDIPCNPPV